MVRRLGRVLVYGVLLGGAVLFSFPFLWMAATSFKVDRELFGKEFRLLPRRPEPRRMSPYVDERVYAALEGPYQEELLGWLEPRVGEELERLGESEGTHGEWMRFCGRRWRGGCISGCGGD